LGCVQVGKWQLHPKVPHRGQSVKEATNVRRQVPVSYVNCITNGCTFLNENNKCQICATFYSRKISLKKINI
jgi:hypothetical protein